MGARTRSLHQPGYRRLGLRPTRTGEHPALPTGQKRIGPPAPWQKHNLRSFQHARPHTPCSRRRGEIATRARQQITFPCASEPDRASAGTWINSRAGHQFETRPGYERPIVARIQACMEARLLRRCQSPFPRLGPQWAAIEWPMICRAKSVMSKRGRQLSLRQQSTMCWRRHLSQRHDQAACVRG